MSDSAASDAPRATAPCLSCGLPAPPEAPHFPFCSLRCRAEDLHGWLSGSYAGGPWDVEDEAY